MPHTIDIGGTPANEPCAQLGRTKGFERLNRLEVAAYKAAMIGRFGSPPEGCSYVELRNPHDFGIYYTLGIKIEHEDGGIAATADYVDLAQDGLGTWLEAGFPQPIVYDSAANPTSVRELNEVIVAALLITRPSPAGVFSIADNETIHRHLTAAYPAEAAAAAARLSEAK